jgi:hypothetical protein
MNSTFMHTNNSNTFFMIFHPSLALKLMYSQTELFFTQVISSKDVAWHSVMNSVADKANQPGHCRLKSQLPYVHNKISHNCFYFYSIELLLTHNHSNK